MITTNHHIIIMKLQSFDQTPIEYFPCSQNCLPIVVMYNFISSTSISISGLSSSPKLPSYVSNCLQDGSYDYKSLELNLSVRVSFPQNFFFLTSLAPRRPSHPASYPGSKCQQHSWFCSLLFSSMIACIWGTAMPYTPSPWCFEIPPMLIQTITASCNFFPTNLYFPASQSPWPSLFQLYNPC